MYGSRSGAAPDQETEVKDIVGRSELSPLLTPVTLFDASAAHLASFDGEDKQAAKKIRWINFEKKLGLGFLEKKLV